MSPTFHPATFFFSLSSIDFLLPGGTTDTGNIAWRFFSHELDGVIRDFLRSLDDSIVNDIMTVLRGVGVVLRVASSKRRVMVDKLSEFCKDLYCLILSKFPWVHVSESMHHTLAHIPELIELNGGVGLGTMTEQGAEG